MTKPCEARASVDVALGGAGYEIVGEATNGQQGLDLIMQSDPDIVITTSRCLLWMALR